VRILIVAPRVPWPPHQGTAIRNLAIALELGRRHQVTILAFESAADELGPLEKAGIQVVSVPLPSPRPMARRVFDLPMTAGPDLSRRLDSEAMRQATAALVDEAATAQSPFDVVQIEGLEMAAHGLAAADALQAAFGRRPQVIYDAHNAEWVLQERAWRADSRHLRTWVGAIYSRIQTRKLRRFERELLEIVDATVAVSEADAAALREVAPAASITVVPNGVDTESRVSAVSTSPVKEGTCLFIGKMDFRPNIDAVLWFCREVWPHVRAARPDARFWIVGRDPTDRVRALHDGDAGIEVVGAVPDVAPWLARAAVVVVPLRIGGGTRLKVLEAMVAAKAIAATTMAVEGLAVQDDREALLADEPAALSAMIVRLLGDSALRRRLGAAARETALERYGWSGLVPDIEALYESVATR
jgi:polysaccharide biosynthesis protein PslH